MGKLLKGCVFIIFTVFGILIIISLVENQQERMIHEGLAKTLQVKIENYPYPESFPIGYFETKLTAGMTIRDVHDVMKGYEKVYSCQRSEIYYFYSVDGDKATRMLVLYDLNGLFEKIQSEDRNSRYLNGYIKDCSEGQIEP